MNKPTLYSEVEQFFYTHAPQALHRKVLLDLVKVWENAYGAKIVELESRVAELEGAAEKPDLIQEFDRLVNEGAPSYNSRKGRMWPDDDDYGNRSD